LTGPYVKEDAMKELPRTLAVGLITTLLFAAGSGAAVAATPPQSPTPTPSPTATATVTPTPVPVRPGHVRSETVLPGEDGEFRTVATQVGEVTEVSEDSVTVKSADGFSRAYTVDDETRVSAGRQGLTSLKTGDSVSVTANVEGEKATAEHVMDLGRGPVGHHAPAPTMLSELPELKPAR
jgi:hypothetical protein